MPKVTSRPSARLLPFTTVTAEYGLTESALERLVEEGHLKLVQLPSIRRRLLDRRDVEALIESSKGGQA